MSTTRHTDTVEVILKDQRRRRWSPAEKAALVRRTYEPGMSVSLAQVSALLEHTRDSLQRVDAILADAQAVAGAAREASADLGALRAEVEANLRKASRMIDELNRRWPFAREPQLKLP